MDLIVDAVERALSKERQQQLLGKTLRGNMHNPLVRKVLFGVNNLRYNDGSSICPSHSSAPHNGYQAGTTDAKGNHVTKNILMIRSSSQGTEDNNRSINENTVFILDSEAHANVTGVFSFSSIAVVEENFVLTAANGHPMETFYSGSIRHDRFELHNVHYCPDVGNRIIISGSRLDTLGYSYGFGEGRCIVTDLSTGKVVGEGRLIDGDYIMDYLRIPRDRVFVPRPQEPALVISVWKTICSGFRTFTGLMFRRASTQTPRRPPV